MSTWFPRKRPPPRQESSLFDPEPLEQGLKALRNELPTPIRTLSLLVYQEKIVLHAQDPDDPTRVDEHVYRGGRVSGPVPVKLVGKGRLDDNLFDLDAARIERLPSLVEAARAETDVPNGRVSRVLLKRNLPESMDIHFQVFITSPRHEAQLEADKDAELLD